MTPCLRHNFGRVIIFHLTAQVHCSMFRLLVSTHHNVLQLGWAEGGSGGGGSSMAVVVIVVLLVIGAAFFTFGQNLM